MNMFEIQLMNKIAAVGTACFSGDKYAVGDSFENPDAIMVRSASLHEMPFGDKLKAIARAGAGVNNIPVEACAEKGIVVFNTPGANANAVKELVIAGLLLASRNIVDGINWAKTLVNTDAADVAKQVEKGKAQFSGCEIEGKRLGVIGLGAIGAIVANAARSLGMEVLGFDKFLTVDAAWSLSRGIKRAENMEEIFKTCDYITVHVPSTPETRGMFNRESLAMMKDGARLLNFSRADLAISDDILAALESGKLAKYVTDFPTAELVGAKSVIAIPHLGASTGESEDNCAVMAAHELIDFLECGNIKNSVNYPDVVLPHNGDYRICVFHKNVPSIISQISAALSEASINIENLLNRSKKEYAYTIVETLGQLPEDVKTKLSAIEGIIRIRIIH